MRKGFYEALLSEINPSEWVKVGSKHYQHVSGVQVKYDHNTWLWEIIGGKNCGRVADVKWVAQMEALGIL